MAQRAKGRGCMDYIDLGRRVRKQRIALGWTQEELAEKVGMSTSFIGHVERGSRKASLETLIAIANAMEISTDYLLAGSLNGGSLGPVPQNLRPHQKQAMQEILTTLQSQLLQWNNDAEEDEGQP